MAAAAADDDGWLDPAPGPERPDWYLGPGIYRIDTLNDRPPITIPYNQKAAIFPVQRTSRVLMVYCREYNGDPIHEQSV
jgi:hypothetical protein